MPTFTESSDERSVSVTINQTRDAVADLGMDPNGNRSISNTINNLNGVVVEYPPGEYKVDSMSGVGNGDVAHVARDGPGTVTWKVPRGYNHWMYNFEGGSVVIDGIHFDMTATNAAGGIRIWPCSSDSLVRNVEFIGRAFAQNSGTVNMLQVAASGFQTNIMLSNVVSKDNRLGDAYAPGGGTHDKQRVGVFTNAPSNNNSRGSAHNGYLILKDCDLREFANNATYVSRHHGNVHIEDCYFENNNVSAMRFSGPDSHARRCCVVVDASKLNQTPRHTGGGGENCRGTIIEQKRRFAKSGGTVIEDCKFIWQNLPSGFNSQGPLHVGPAGKSGVFRRCEVINNIDGVPSIYIRGTGKFSNKIGSDRDWDLINCTFHGSAGGNLDIPNDRNVVVRDSCNDSNQGWGSVRDATLRNTQSGSCPVLLPGLCEGDFSGGGGLPDENADIEILTPQGGPLVEYTFKVDAEAVRKTSTGDNISGGSNDSITQRNGVYVVSGTTGNGYGDAFTIYGSDIEFTDWQSSDAQHTVRWDGQQIDPQNLPGLTPPNEKPVGEFSYSPQSPEAGQEITFDGTNSEDPDGEIQSHSWDFGDGTGAAGHTIAHTYDQPGEYTVTLVVTDSRGATAETMQTVLVSESSSGGGGGGGEDDGNGMLYLLLAAAAKEGGAF